MTSMTKSVDPMYMRFGLSLVASLLAMYTLAFSQVDLFRHIEWSLSVAWISLSMVSAMGLIMLVAMQQMLPNKRLNMALFVGFGLMLIIAVLGSRYEALVGDDAFLRSMIPHHSRAIHMCQEATLADQEIQELCQSIIESQREEINQMYSIMERRD